MARGAAGLDPTIRPAKKMINVRLNPELWRRAKAAASDRGLTLERWVTDALEAHIQRARDPEPNGAGAGSPDLASLRAEVNDLVWRVAALEQAVDYLASATGAGFPGPAARSGTTAPAPATREPAAGTCMGQP